MTLADPDTMMTAMVEAQNIRADSLCSDGDYGLVLSVV